MFSIAFLFSLHQVSVRKGTLNASTAVGTFFSIATTAALFSLTSLIAILFFHSTAFSLKFVELMVIAGVIHFAFARAVFYQCISRLGANVAATLATTRIFFAAALGYFILGEGLSFKTAVMTILVFLGIAMLMFRVVKEVYGVALGIMTGFLSALASIFAKEGMLTQTTNAGLEAVTGTALGYVASLAVFYLFLTLLGSVRIQNICTGEIKFSRNYLPFVLGGVFVGFGHFLRYMALFHYSVCLVETFISVYPIFTYLLSGLLVRRFEIFNLRFLAASLLIIAGVEFYLVY